MTFQEAFFGVLALSWTTLPGAVGALLFIAAAPISRRVLFDWSHMIVRPLRCIVVGFVIGALGVLTYGTALYGVGLEHTGVFPLVVLGFFVIPATIDLILWRPKPPLSEQKNPRFTLGW